MIQLYKIGEISKACNISIKTLRYYEDFGLITPREVDIYTGYRYYDEDNIKSIFKIQFLKDLGFSLSEIKDFDEKSINMKYKNIENEITKLKNKLNIISYLNKQKGEKVMKPFINDERVIGKWKYVCSAESIEKFNYGETYHDKEAFSELYFLPNGEGYWVFEGWSKGVIYYFKGNYYKYSIANNKLFVETYDENQEYEHTLIYEKENSREYTKDDLRKKDNVDLEFELDKRAVGSWVAIDWIPITKKFNYVPKTSNNLFLTGLSLLENGDCFEEFSNGNIVKISWTKDYIVSKKQSLASNFIITTIDGEDYLIKDWKSGDYVFGGTIYGCYVFKRAK